MDVEVRHGKLNKEYVEWCEKREKAEGEVDEPMPKMTVEDDSILKKVEVDFDKGTHIADAVHHMLVISKRLRPREDSNGIKVVTNWNGYEMRVQWSWNREIDWDYVEETTNNVAEQHDEPCGIWLRKDTSTDEKSTNKKELIVKAKPEDLENAIKKHPELKEKFEEIDEMVEDSLKVNLDCMKKMEE